MNAKIWGNAVRLKAGVAACAVTAVVLSLVGMAPAASAATGPTEIPAPKATTMSADSLPTAQIDGIVWDQAIVGNTVFVGGQFANARPAGAAAGVAQVPRSNLMSYNLTTGVMTSFAPVVNGPINTVEASPDGTRIYIGGTFTNVNGSARSRLAAFDTATGQLVNDWKPAANAVVRSIAVTGNTVFITGNFTQMAGNDRGRAAAVSTSGALLPWAPQLEARGNAIVANEDGSKVVIGGIFTTLNGSDNPGYGLGMVDGVTGALLPFSTNNVVRNGGADAGIYSLKSDGDSVYGSGFHFGGGGNLEGIFRSAWNTGDLTWVEDCHGDTYDVAVSGDAVYGAGHPHYCGSLENGYPQSDPWTFYRAVAFTKNVNRITPYGLGYGYYDWGGTPAPDLLNWFPEFDAGTVSGASQGPWSVAANSQYVAYAGEFTKVNGTVQQGLARFTVREAAPKLQGPRGANTTPTATAIGDGRVRISIPSAWDRDNEYLTYKLIRDGKNSTPIQEANIRSKSPDWGLPPIVFTDEGLVDGTTHTYRLRVNDADGNVAWGNPVSVTAVGTGTASAYRSSVLADAPLNYWPLNEASGPSYDWAGGSDLTVQSGVTRAVDGALSDGSKAATFNGTSSGSAGTTTRIQGPQKFAIEAWFKSTSTSGGKIVGFGNSTTGNSSSYDRHIYLDSSGRVNFGVYPGEMRVVTSGDAYNDGQWHQVVANLGAAGMELFVDGKQVGQRDDTTYAQDYSGYWRVGGDTAWSGDSYLRGSIDEVAIYAAPLTRTSILNHYVASGRESSVPPAPTDAYGAAVYAKQPTLYWRLSETAATTARDASGQESEGKYSGSLNTTMAGALLGVDNTAVKFTNGSVIGQTPYVNPLTYSLESWFKTSSNNGGKIVGFGSSRTGDSGSVDRHVYLLNNGKLAFGVNAGGQSVITSPAAVNDGQWHHVVATQSSAGLRLYLDGSLVASNGTTTAQNYLGYWHVGRDATWSGSSSNAFNGTIDEVAVYPTALTLEDVKLHQSLGATGSAPNVAPTADFTSTVNKLAVAVAATAADSDGTIVSYDWNWGDGSAHGSGATAEHAYAAAGTHNVVLTVTDDDGATTQVTHAVTTVANVSPSPAFAVQVNQLDLAVDASESTDSDGTIASYSWNWGDGSAHSAGKVANHSYADAGNYIVTLTVTDNDGAMGVTEQQVLTVAPAANVAPTAEFTSVVTGLGVAVDASASTDADGSIVGYSWKWGDTSADGSGVNATHTYTAAGDYVITLTVTDNAGSTGVLTKTVSVEAPTVSTPLASDVFGRDVSNALGSADVGGAWALGPVAAAYSVGDGVARFTHLKGGQTYEAYLSGVSSSESIVSTDLLIPRPTAGSAYAAVVARRVGVADYRARVVVGTTGTVTLQLQRSGTTLAAVASGVTIADGDVLKVKVEAIGTSPTTIRAKVWKSTQAEPAAWMLTQEDSTAALQAAGSVGLSTYLGATVTPMPFVVAFDNFTAVTPVAEVPPVVGKLAPNVAPAPVPAPAPPVEPNQAPVAAFTASTSELTASVDGSTSTDPDGTIAQYSWSWGDNTPASTGATASHVYAATGTYTVTLTVTDNKGATHSTTSTVTIVVRVAG